MDSQPNDLQPVSAAASPSNEPVRADKSASNNPVIRILVYFGILLALAILAGLVINAVLHPILHQQHIRQLSTVVLEAVNEGLIGLCSVAALWILVRFVEHRRMSDAGYSVRGIITETTIGSILGFAAISLSIGILALIGIYHMGPVNSHAMIGLLLFTSLMTAVFEETAFRGVVLRVLDYRYGSAVALIASSLVFGFAHITNAFALHLPLWQGIVGAGFICLEAGLFLGAVYIATRRLWMSIGIHWAWNFFEGPVYGTDVSGTSGDPTLIHARVTGPFLLSGGAFGPEASIVLLLVCTAFGLLLLRVAIRSGNWKPAGQWQPQSLPRYKPYIGRANDT